MANAIVYDVTRLFLGATAIAPRGIDRVDIGMARHLFESWPADVLGCMPTAHGIRLFDRARVNRALSALQAIWAESQSPTRDEGLAAVMALLRPGAVAPPVGRRRRFRWHGPLCLIRRAGFSFGRSAVRHAPTGAIYLNVGQLTWAMPLITHWLRRRPDLCPLFMIHDVIPLEYPGLVSKADPRLHRTFLHIVARHAKGLFLSSRAASGAVNDALAVLGAPVIPADVGPLPVAPAFLQQAGHDPALAAHTYFVICGAIERRKNHALLLDVWTRLVTRHGPAAPKLLIAGAPAHGAAPLMDAIAARTGLRGHVIVARSLSSPALRQVITHARALLMPSLAEGYGLPVAEALTLGTPVVASNIPSHLEVAGDCARFCPPGDVVAWDTAITRLTFDPEFAAASRAMAARFTPLPNKLYYARVDAFLRRF